MSNMSAFPAQQQITSCSQVLCGVTIRLYAKAADVVPLCRPSPKAIVLALRKALDPALASAGYLKLPNPRPDPRAMLQASRTTTLSQHSKSPPRSSLLIKPSPRRILDFMTASPQLPNRSFTSSSITSAPQKTILNPSQRKSIHADKRHLNHRYSRSSQSLSAPPSQASAAHTSILRQRLQRKAEPFVYQKKSQRRFKPPITQLFLCVSCCPEISVRLVLGVEAFKRS